MVENNIENREKLAGEVVDSWDMDTLIDFAKQELMLNYSVSDEDFQRDWESTIE